MIYQKYNLTHQEQIDTMKSAKEWYENYKLDPKKKYISDYENQGDWRKEGEVILYSNKKKILSIIYTILANKASPNEFITSLKEYKPIIRDGKIHNPMCEYAKGDDCDCPCMRKWHGLAGSNLEK